MIQEIFVKRGSTLLLSGHVKLPAGTWTATCKVSKPQSINKYDVVVSLNALVEPLPTGETHTLQLSQTATLVATWPTGNLLCDIKFQSGADVIYSDTFIINVETSIT